MTRNRELDLEDLYECDHTPSVPIVDDYTGEIEYWVCNCGKQVPERQDNEDGD